MNVVEKTEYKIDRKGWAKGPWDDEPDRVEFRTAAGFPALIIRNHMGALCGYVGLPPGNAARALAETRRDGAGYNNVLVDVHGGLSYADRCSGGICHTPAPGETDDVFWLGFDCGHAGDLMPGHEARMAELGVTTALGIPDFRIIYRDVAYVRAECESLAAQLAVYDHEAAAKAVEDARAAFFEKYAPKPEGK